MEQQFTQNYLFNCHPDTTACIPVQYTILYFLFLYNWPISQRSLCAPEVSRWRIFRNWWCKIFLQAGCPSCHPANSVNAMKGSNPTSAILKKPAPVTKCFDANFQTADTILTLRWPLNSICQTICANVEVRRNLTASLALSVSGWQAAAVSSVHLPCNPGEHYVQHVTKKSGFRCCKTSWFSFIYAS